MECDRERAEPDPARIHIIGEDDNDLIVVVRVPKSALAANFNFITALFELGNLLTPET